jgi:hypothetical protein
MRDCARQAGGIRPMKTATALTVTALGAILAFAVTAHPYFFNFNVAGWVLMVTGVAGTFLPRRGYGWLRRRLVLNTGGGRRNNVDIRPRRFSRLLVPGGLITERRAVVGTNPAAHDASATRQAVADPVSADEPVESETIEQFIEE